MWCIINACMCDIAMMLVWNVTIVAKTLNHDYVDQGETKHKEKKIRISTYTSLWPLLQNLNLGHSTLFRRFGNFIKLKIRTFESNKCKTNQKKNQKPLTYDNGHVCHLHQGTHFEPLY